MSDVKPPRKTSTTASVQKCKAGIVAKGGRRMPDGYLQPAEAVALSALLDAKYAESPLAVMRAALMDAYKKLSRTQSAVK